MGKKSLGKQLIKIEVDVVFFELESIVRENNLVKREEHPLAT